MISDLILATERLKTEKKYLTRMVTKLVEENQELLGENRHFREKITSFQTSTVPSVGGEIDEVKSTFTKIKKLQDLEKEEEISEFHEHKVHKHRAFLTREKINYIKVYLQQCAREMEEKKEDIIKEKHQISETRGTVAEQGKIIEDLQIQINHLQEELKNSQLTVFQPVEQKEVNLESPMPEVAKANLGENMISKYVHFPTFRSLCLQLETVHSCLSKRLSLLRSLLCCSLFGKLATCQSHAGVVHWVERNRNWEAQEGCCYSASHVTLFSL
nr:uncharacterized protein LOC112545962 isoform X2 [Pelodiscus sinensis]|eukprot:XP_025040890.1 uncharacterized protein LOC112545962 isoform X2 [Pelodiscus sinensis]